MSISNTHSLAIAPIREVTAEPEGYYLLQAGVFSSFANAKRFHQELAENLIAAEIIAGDKQAVHRVILNKFKSKAVASKALAAYHAKYPVKLYISFVPYLASTATVAAI